MKKTAVAIAIASGLGLSGLLVAKTQSVAQGASDP